MQQHALSSQIGGAAVTRHCNHWPAFANFGTYTAIQLNHAACLHNVVRGALGKIGV